MNILYIGFDIEGVGGIATYSRYQVRALRDLGHAVRVVSVNKTTRRFAPGYVDRHIEFSGRVAVVAGLLGEVLTRRYDVIVFNHVYLAMFGRIARALNGARYTINVYNVDILEPLPPLREYAFGRADLIISDCRYTIDNMPRFHRRVPPTGILFDPVDTSFFRPIPTLEAKRELERRFGLADLDRRFVALTVAHMAGPPNNNKGHRQTIDALQLLKDPRFLYLITGEGPDRPAIEAHVKERGVGDQVKFLGLVDQDALPLLYAGADVATLVARGGAGLGEGVPLGLIEASSCGTAFICGNEDGSVEAIDPARPNGFAIDPARPEQLAAKLRELADNPALCQAMGRNGVGVVTDVFAFDKFTAQQSRLLAQAMGR